MAHESNSAKSPFASLAVEIRQDILCALPDLRTLQAAMDADVSLQVASSGATSLILGRILSNQIPTELLPEALAVQASSHFDRKNWSKEQVSKILDVYFLRQSSPSPLYGLTLEEAQHLSDVHENVQFFVDAFSSMALSVHPITRDTIQSPAPLSPTERSRLANAIYRFELYCNLFRTYLEDREQKFSPLEQNALFLDKFSPWENEQLACVYDVFLEMIKPAFVDVAEHDVVWGELMVPFDDKWGHPLEEYYNNILALGLGFLRQIISATTYEERHSLLSPHHGAGFDFLMEALWELGGNGNEQDYSLSEYTEDMTQALINQPALKDANSGPYLSWYWVHAEMLGPQFTFCDGNRYIRLRGYVMWDEARLTKEWNLFDQPYEEPEDARKEPDSGRTTEEIVYSFDRRSEIWMRGGMGWWSKDDESKIVWSSESG